MKILTIELFNMLFSMKILRIRLRQKYDAHDVVYPRCDQKFTRIPWMIQFKTFRNVRNFTHFDGIKKSYLRTIYTVYIILNVFQRNNSTIILRNTRNSMSSYNLRDYMKILHVLIFFIRSYYRNNPPGAD